MWLAAIDRRKASLTFARSIRGCPLSQRRMFSEHPISPRCSPSGFACSLFRLSFATVLGGPFGPSIHRIPGRSDNGWDWDFTEAAGGFRAALSLEIGGGGPCRALDRVEGDDAGDGHNVEHEHDKEGARQFHVRLRHLLVVHSVGQAEWRAGGPSRPGIFSCENGGIFIVLVWQARARGHGIGRRDRRSS